jgi:hypothetical protein
MFKGDINQIEIEAEASFNHTKGFLPVVIIHHGGYSWNLELATLTDSKEGAIQISKDFLTEFGFIEVEE